MVERSAVNRLVASSSLALGVELLEYKIRLPVPGRLCGIIPTSRDAGFCLRSAMRNYDRQANPVHGALKSS